jgi:hypothetical protein
MAVETVPGRVAVLFLFNSPIILGLGSVFFSSWSDFFESFIPGFDFGFWSWFLDRHTYARFENYKLYLFFILIAALLYGEYRLIWPSSPAPGPVISISSLSLIGLTPRSTWTPPALPSALSQYFAFSAPFSASVQAGPVSFFR